MATKQIPYIRKPVSFNGHYTHLPVDYSSLPAVAEQIPHRDIELNGITYSVPKNISRAHSAWIVTIGGRKFYFSDDRHSPAPFLSLRVAYDFMLDNANKDPASIQARPRQESRTKNIEFGIAGICAKWRKGRTGNTCLQLSLQAKIGHTLTTFSINMKSSDLTQTRIELELGKIVYMKHIIAVNPQFTVDERRAVWKRIRSGKFSTPMYYPLPDATMVQIAENLEMRKKIWSGDGAVHPYTNKYVR